VPLVCWYISTVYRKLAFVLKSSSLSNAASKIHEIYRLQCVPIAPQDVV
jgi:hypothetical protein